RVRPEKWSRSARCRRRNRPARRTRCSLLQASAHPIGTGSERYFLFVGRAFIFVGRFDRFQDGKPLAQRGAGQGNRGRPADLIVMQPQDQQVLQVLRLPQDPRRLVRQIVVSEVHVQQGGRGRRLRQVRGPLIAEIVVHNLERVQERRLLFKQPVQ